LKPKLKAASGTKPKKKQAAKQARDDLAAQARAKIETQDPFSRANLRKLGLRLGIPLLLGWIVAIVIPGWIAKAIAAGVTLLILGFAAYVLHFARKSRAVADLVRGADSAESRKQALDKLESGFKPGDTAATFARAQLQLQDDPRAALATLETVKLDKVMATVADEARCQRAMIHLMLGETADARVLADQVDLARHKEAKERAALAAIVGEAWARSGHARKAAELLEKIDVNDAIYEQVRPQLLRALAFAYAWSNQTSLMKKQLRKLGSINQQLLMGFITKKKNPMGVNPRGVHPALEKEALGMVMRSGAVPRKMQVRRM
jgi:F0F1-type ATP synthase assembly protein I